jgi:hypothetical protein
VNYALLHQAEVVDRPRKLSKLSVAMEASSFLYD